MHTKNMNAAILEDSKFQCDLFDIKMFPTPN